MKLLEKLHHPERYYVIFLKWGLLGTLMGLLGGLLGGVIAMIATRNLKESV